MIIKMKKYSFLVYHKAYQAFLEAIREQGILHIKEIGAIDANNSTLRDKTQLLNRIDEALKFLKLRLVPDKVDVQAAEKADGLKVLHDLEALRHELDSTEQKIASLDKDLQQLAPWDEYSPSRLNKLKEAGWEIQFFSCGERKWNPEWERLFNAFIISRKGTVVNFVTVTPTATEIEIDADIVRLPAVSTSDLHGQMAKVSEHKDQIQKEFDKYAVLFIPALEQARLKVQQEFDFDKVILNTNMAAEDTVAVVEGFLPVIYADKFEDFLKSQPVYFEAKTPEADESVPVVLKNNWFAKMFEPIGELYTLPNHRELDLTAWYAPFYWLFFGFCLGDAGYGLVLTIVGFVMARRLKPELKGYARLIGFLGISTIIFGLIGGTLFGMNLYELRLGFYATLDDLLKAKETDINQVLFNLAIALGVIQIIYGMFVKAANEIYQGGFRSSFSTFGWILILFGTAAYFWMTKMAVESMIVKIISYGLIGVGFLGAFIFSSPNRSILANFGLGFWDTYNMATGLLGDTLSYIRLFALGISSTILGYVFNSLALSLSPDIPVVKFIVMAIILLVGHTINLLMGMLGSFVHPMRLTFVEFYKNAGFSGGGKRYSPFRNRVTNN